MSCNNRFPLIAIALIGVLGMPARAHAQSASARLQVTPRQTEVFVDGFLAGVVDDFDGFAQRLRVASGEHVIELYLDGHKTVRESIASRCRKTAIALSRPPCT